MNQLINSQNFYRPTGKFDVSNLIMVCLLILPLWLVSFLYAGLLHWNPIKFLNAVIFFGFTIGVSQLIVLAINISNTRNKGLARVIFFIFYFTSLYFTWASYLAIWQGRGPMEMLNTSLLASSFSELYDTGAYTIFGVSNSGIAGAIMWFLEVVGLGFVCYSSATVTVDDEVYCENCDRWVKPIKDLYQFSYTNAEELVHKFMNQDLSFLDQAEEFSKDSELTFSIDANSCNTCDSTHYMSLRSTKIGEDESNMMLVENLQVTPDTFKTIYKKSEHWVSYTESGKFSEWLWLSLPIMGALTLLVATIYQALAIAIENYFITFILWLAYLGFLWKATRLILRSYAIRNSIISSFFGIILGSIAVYLTQAGLVVAESPGLLGEVFKLDLVWSAINARVYWHEFEWLVWTGLIIETTSIFLAPLFAADDVSTSDVFCENCKRWAEKVPSLAEFKYQDKEQLEHQFTRQNLAFLDEGSKVDFEAEVEDYYRISGEWCSNCDELHTLSLSSIHRTVSSDNKVRESVDNIKEDIMVRKDVYDRVKAYNKVNQGRL